MSTTELIIWVLRHDLKPKPVSSRFKYHFKVIQSAFMMVIYGLIMIPLSLVLICLEPFMIFIRPMFCAVFKPKAVENLIVSLSESQNQKEKPE